MGSSLLYFSGLSVDLGAVQSPGGSNVTSSYIADCFILIFRIQLCFETANGESTVKKTNYQLITQPMRIDLKGDVIVGYALR